MKKSILRYLTKRIINRQEKDSSIGYRYVQKVAVLINTEDHWNGLKDFLDELKQDNKEPTCLFYYGQNDPAEAGHSAFHPSDIGLFGSFKSDAVQSFLNAKYDYCFVLANSAHPFVEYVAANTQCQTTIGFVYEEGNCLADLQVKPDHGRELNDLLKYTKQLS
jgi:hypothetical protein